MPRVNVVFNENLQSLANFLLIWFGLIGLMLDNSQSVNFGGTSNRKNLKISVFGCFRVNLLEFGFRKYDLRKFGKLCNLLFLFL